MLCSWILNRATNLVDVILTHLFVLLQPLSIVFGWSIAQEFVAGAHDMDLHFVETNPRHNLPVLLALTDIWNDTFLGSSSRIITPFTEAFAGYPAFVGALEAQSCGVAADRSGGGPAPSSRLSCSALVLDGGLNSTYDRALYQGTKVMNSELVMTMDSQVAFNASRTIGVHGMDDIQATQDARMCSLFAHADELAFGYESSTSDPILPSGMPTMSSKPFSADVSEGNRPSALLICGKLDAFACGQLVALAEHRAIVKAHIWGIDPFARELGSSLRMHRTVHLKEELETLFINKDDSGNEDGDDNEDPRMNLSTKTILRHYANLMRDRRVYTVAGP
jgi:glucose-6-phosphate isomerase